MGFTSCIEVNWEELRERALKASFPSLHGVYIREPEVRKAIVEALATEGQDTAYGLSLKIRKPLPSVVKALKALEEKGYVVAEVKPYRRKREASVYRLSELGEAAYLALKLPDYDLSKHLEGKGPLSKDIKKSWVEDPCLRQVLSYAILVTLLRRDLERNLSEVRKYIKEPIPVFLIMHGYILLAEVLANTYKTYLRATLEKEFEPAKVMLYVIEEHDIEVSRLRDNLLRLLREREDLRKKLLETLSGYLSVRYCISLMGALGSLLAKDILDSGSEKFDLGKWFKEKEVFINELNNRCFSKS